MDCLASRNILVKLPSAVYTAIHDSQQLKSQLKISPHTLALELTVFSGNKPITCKGHAEALLESLYLFAVDSRGHCDIRSTVSHRANLVLSKPQALLKTDSHAAKRSTELGSATRKRSGVWFTCPDRDAARAGVCRRSIAATFASASRSAESRISSTCSSESMDQPACLVRFCF